MESTNNQQLQSSDIGIKTKDPNGNIVAGLYRTKAGGLSVADKEAYDKYKRDQRMSVMINDMKDEFDHIKDEFTEIKLMLLELIKIKESK